MPPGLILGAPLDSTEHQERAPQSAQGVRRRSFNSVHVVAQRDHGASTMRDIFTPIIIVHVASYLVIWWRRQWAGCSRHQAKFVHFFPRFVSTLCGGRRWRQRLYYQWPRSTKSSDVFDLNHKHDKYIWFFILPFCSHAHGSSRDENEWHEPPLYIDFTLIHLNSTSNNFIQIIELYIFLLLLLILHSFPYYCSPSRLSDNSIVNIQQF